MASINQVTDNMYKKAEWNDLSEHFQRTLKERWSSFEQALTVNNC